MRSEIGEEADVIGAGDGSVVAVGDPRIESRLGESVAESTGPRSELVVRDRWPRGDVRDPTPLRRASPGRPAGYGGKTLPAGAQRMLAKELGVALALVSGSGPDGRIERRDVERFAGDAAE